MKCTQNSSSCSKFHNSVTFVIILFILSSTHARFIPQGKRKIVPGGLNSKLNGNEYQVAENEDGYHGMMELRNEMIGSRPPICEWKKYCRRCAKCQAIQVPIAGPKNDPDTRRDYLSNYKPMSWKCKCGDFTFNP